MSDAEESGGGGPADDVVPDDPAFEGPAYCAHTEYRTGADHPELPRTGENASGLEARVWDALRAVEDPEMPVPIVDLGLIYGVYADPTNGEVRVDMTLTYTGCPARDYLLSSVERAIESVDGVENMLVNLLWSPEWTVGMVTEEGREALREFGVAV